jgi:hypothetical protein
MAKYPFPGGKPNAMITTTPPRHQNCPITVFRTQGRVAMIDGRRRANLWRKTPGLYPVLVVEVEPEIPPMVANSEASGGSIENVSNRE